MKFTTILPTALAVIVFTSMAFVVVDKTPDEDRPIKFLALSKDFCKLKSGDSIEFSFRDSVAYMSKYHSEGKYMIIVYK